MQNMIRVFNENLKKLSHFYLNIINPLTICKLMLDLNNLLAERSASIGDGNEATYIPVTTYEGLKQVLKEGGV